MCIVPLYLMHGGHLPLYGVMCRWLSDCTLGCHPCAEGTYNYHPHTLTFVSYVCAVCGKSVLHMVFVLSPLVWPYFGASFIHWKLKWYIHVSCCSAYYTLISTPFIPPFLLQGLIGLSTLYTTGTDYCALTHIVCVSMYVCALRHARMYVHVCLHRTAHVEIWCRVIWELCAAFPLPPFLR